MESVKILEKDIVYFDMDGVLVELGNKPEEWNTCKNEKGYFLKQKPINGAIQAFHTLANHCEVYILSTPVWSNPDCWKEKRIWVEKHLGEKAKKRLILTHNKSLNRGKILIDDSLNHGVSEFSGIHIHFGTPQFSTWDEIMKKLELVHSHCDNRKKPTKNAF